jgi:O-antigen/teichoic acid export membrane protein
VHLELLTQRGDVVQRAAGRCANKRVHVCVELDERVGEVRTHEPVGSGDEAGPAAEELAELPPQVSDGIIRPGGVMLVCFHAAVPADEQPKGSPERGRSAVRSGAFTGLSYVTLSLAAAVAGAFLAHKFGRSRETDGFMAAYGVYLVLVLGAQAFRMVVVPDLTRAEAEGRLGSEFRAYALAFLAVAVPATILASVFSHFLGELITGRLPAESAAVAADALPWLVPAAFAQLIAALAASALAAKDSYVPAALGFALGGIGGVVFFVLAADSHGLVALAWGLTLNGAIAIGLPMVVLLLRGNRLRLHRGVPLRLGYRLWRLLYGAAVPVALQGLYVIALRFAAGTGEGSVTSLSYAYLLAATFVSATAFSLSLISAATLTRRGVDAESAAEHVVHSAWVSLAFVGAAAGLVALVGGRIVTAVLGDAFSGNVGDELGRLVVFLSPWMVANAAFLITYPLVFVMHRTRLLIPLAVAAVVVDIPISIVGRALWGLTGVTVALGVSTLLAVLGLMAALAPRMLVLTVVGLGRLSILVGASTALAFGGASLLLGAVPAAAAGLALYALLLVAMRQLGLAQAWHYVRALH